VYIREQVLVTCYLRLSVGDSATAQCPANETAPINYSNLLLPIPAVTGSRVQSRQLRPLAEKHEKKETAYSNVVTVASKWRHPARV